MVPEHLPSLSAAEQKPRMSVLHIYIVIQIQRQIHLRLRGQKNTHATQKQIQKYKTPHIYLHVNPKNMHLFITCLQFYHSHPRFNFSVLDLDSQFLYMECGRGGAEKAESSSNCQPSVEMSSRSALPQTSPQFRAPA